MIKLKDATIQLHLFAILFFEHYQQKVVHDPSFNSMQSEEFWWEQFKLFIESSGFDNLNKQILPRAIISNG